MDAERCVGLIVATRCNRAAAGEMDSTSAAVAMAWNATKDGFTIIGPRTLNQLNVYIQATTLTLSQTQIDYLNKISAVDLGYPYELLLKN